MEAKAIWKGKMSFEGSAGSGFTLPLGASPAVGGDNDGFRPLELLLVGLAGCTAMDVISLLKKMRQEVLDFEVKVSGDQAGEHPKVFTEITIEYIVRGYQLEREKVERAVELSEVRYCSAQAMLAKTAKIERKITIQEAEAQ